MSFLRFRVTQKGFAIAIIFFPFFFPQQIWMDWRKLLVEFCSFVKIYEYGLIRNIGKKTLCDKY